MARRLRELTFTVSLSQGTIRDPYVACTVEVDLDDGTMATLSPSGPRPWATVPPELRRGLERLVAEVVSEVKAETFDLKTGQEEPGDGRTPA